MAWTTSYYHYDALGSTRELTDGSQAITDTYLHDAYGNQLVGSGATANPFRYVGQLGYYYDADTDTFYVRARTYQPRTIRWLGQDRLSLVRGMAYQSIFVFRGASVVVRLIQSSVNQYIYALLSPTTFSDPSGLEPRFPDDLVLDPGLPDLPIIDIEPPDLGDPVYTLPPGLDLEPYPNQRDVLTCKGFLDSGWQNDEDANFLPQIQNARQCNPKIYCSARCSTQEGIIGVTHPEGGDTKRCNICLTNGNHDYENWLALLIHELTHVQQYQADGTCSCCKTPPPAKDPQPPMGPVGGGDCQKCLDAERPAYQAQAAQLYHDKAIRNRFVIAGLCLSCKNACGKKRCPGFPPLPPIYGRPME